MISFRFFLLCAVVAIAGIITGIWMDRHMWLPSPVHQAAFYGDLNYLTTLPASSSSSSPSSSSSSSSSPPASPQPTLADLDQWKNNALFWASKSSSIHSPDIIRLLLSSG